MPEALQSNACLQLEQSPAHFLPLKCSLHRCPGLSIPAKQPHTINNITHLMSSACAISASASAALIAAFCAACSSHQDLACSI